MIVMDDRVENLAMEESRETDKEVRNVEVFVEQKPELNIITQHNDCENEGEVSSLEASRKEEHAHMVKPIVEEKTKTVLKVCENEEAANTVKQIVEEKPQAETDCKTTMDDVEFNELENSCEGDDSESSSNIDEDEHAEKDSTSENIDESNTEAPLTESELDELVSEFLEVESRAAEAQEALEEESVAVVESDVRAELAERLQGDELEKAVTDEMETYIEQWESVLDDLETQSALLLEQLDGYGIELPSMYRWIESQAPNGCCTEAWKRRAHWAGSQMTSELDQSVKDAEQQLQSCRPVRRQHGRLLEEGASGFLTKKLSIEDNRGSQLEKSEKDWSTFNSIIQSHNSSANASFGSEHWAAVYLASTPQQAAKLGLMLPGVDEVEEIGDIGCSLDDPFYADAIANEKEIDLSEEQKKNFRKIREEDDANITRKLQRRLKQKRQRSRSLWERQELVDKDEKDRPLQEPDQSSNGKIDSSNDHRANGDELSGKAVSRKRPHEDADVDYMKKSSRAVTCSDDEVVVVDTELASSSSDLEKTQRELPVLNRAVDIINVDMLPSPNPKAITDESRVYKCTACCAVLNSFEVERHPLLDVIVCRSCKVVIEEKMQSKDIMTSRDYCTWCGKHENLVGCNSCELLFCRSCISRNLRKECSSDVQMSWTCCSCLPALLGELISECDQALVDVVYSSSESNMELSDTEFHRPVRGRRKKKIRRILDDAELGEETKRKVAMEKARQEHLKSMQEQSSSKSWSRTVTHPNGTVIDGIIGHATEGFIINVAREKDEEPVRLPPSLSTKLKPHQVAGIRFMWENIVQSVRKVKSGDKGLGCILAHTMGLGKTFQVISFLYAAMRCVDLGWRTAVIVTPVNVLHNWRREFDKWKPTEIKPLRVLMLEDVSRDRRPLLLAKWRKKGGVLLIGYAAFRNLSLGRHVKDRNIANYITEALQFGPDILVCDEAHMIKNTRADVTQALKQVKTQRRIALTGSPLQNNLMEYYCMVDFVREGFLGSSHEFRNRFQNPIENGQHANSTLIDVKIMNQRSHILYEQLKGFVQRVDMSVMKKELPPKTVFVITVKLSPLQRKLYKKFLDVHGFTSKDSCEKTIRRSCFFAGYQALAQIWNHPGLLQMAKGHKDIARKEDALENFLMYDGSSDDNLDGYDLAVGEKQRTGSSNVLISKRGDDIFYNEEIKWWEDLLNEKIYKDVDYSGKMVLLLDILSMSSELGDKALVFSQSLLTLDLIELFLSKLSRKGEDGKYWKQGKDWYRLDGSTEGSERQRIVEKFNDPLNKRVKCTLISTRAGSLGINLHAANRVVIVDGSWNPTHDLQAIYRAWRYGQRKPVYAYRLMAHGTMEEKIYKRQVTKEGLAARVVDRQQIHRTMSKEEIRHLFDFGYDENLDNPEQNQQDFTTLDEVKVDEGSTSKSTPTSSFGVSSDKIMEILLSRHFPRWIANYHEHETLLQENEEERLSKEEQDLAWQNFQQSLEWEVVHKVTYNDDMPLARNPVAVIGLPVSDVIQQTKGKAVGDIVPPESNSLQQNKGNIRSRTPHQKKCTNLAHLLTLRSQGTKPGSTTICGECQQEISWETLNRDGKSR